MEFIYKLNHVFLHQNQTLLNLPAASITWPIYHESFIAVMKLSISSITFQFDGTCESNILQITLIFNLIFSYIAAEDHHQKNKLLPLSCTAFTPTLVLHVVARSSKSAHQMELGVHTSLRTALSFRFRSRLSKSN